MTNAMVDATQQRAARVAGLMYLVTMMLGIFSVNFVESDIIVPENSAATVSNIMANELLYRMAVAGEIMMYALVVLLAWALYELFKTINQSLALLALLWRLAEAIIGGGLTVISGLVPLLLLHGETVLEAEHLQFLVRVFLDVRGAGLDVVLLLIGLGGTIFLYLFWVSRYIPRILAAWGIVTYLSMILLSLISILTPDLSDSTRMAFYAPGGLFEIIFGLWLLIKGVEARQ
ncbi:MAG: DUF4386 domain-containing protein [Nitrospinota bacterium]|nr:DUF4386 domain-containing protein [Nitrospinota bacterium]